MQVKMQTVPATLVTHSRPQGRYNFGEVGYDGFIYVLGGYSSNQGKRDDFWRLELCSSTWHRLADWPGGEIEGTSLLLLENPPQILCFGGTSCGEDIDYEATCSKLTAVYNISSNSWETVFEGISKLDSMWLEDEPLISAAVGQSVIALPANCPNLNVICRLHFPISVGSQWEQLTLNLEGAVPKPCSTRLAVVGDAVFFLGDNTQQDGQGKPQLFRLDVSARTCTLIESNLEVPVVKGSRSELFCVNGTTLLIRCHVGLKDESWWICSDFECWSPGTAVHLEKLDCSHEDFRGSFDDCVRCHPRCIPVGDSLYALAGGWDECETMECVRFATLRAPVADRPDSFTSSLKSLINDEQKTDVTFIVENQKVHLCRAVLAARSTYFQSLLYGNLKTSESVITVPDLKLSAFMSVVEWLHTDSLDSLEPAADLGAVLRAANFYRLELMEVKLIQLAINRLATDNAIALLSESEKLQLLTLKSACLSFIRSHHQEFVQAGAYSALATTNASLLVEIMSGESGLPSRKCPREAGT